MLKPLKRVCTQFEVWELAVTFMTFLYGFSNNSKAEGLSSIHLAISTSVSRVAR